MDIAPITAEQKGNKLPGTLPLPAASSSVPPDVGGRVYLSTANGFITLQAMPASVKFYV